MGPDGDQADRSVTEAECLDVIDAIFSTRAMRRVRPDPIPEWILWDILDAAIRGPSSGNVQRWGWIILSDASVKSEIAGWYRDAWNALETGRRARLLAAVERVIPARLRSRSNESDVDPAAVANRASGDHLANNLERAPVWIIVTQSGIRGEPSLVDGADVYGAVQNLMLAARKYGIGTTLTMLHRQREDDVARLLGLPDDTSTVALIPLGFAAAGFSRPRRRPVEEVTHWQRWGQHRARVHRE